MRLRRAVAARFRPTVAGSMVDREVAAARKEDATRRKEAIAAGTPTANWDDLEFWRRVAGSEGWRESLGNGECERVQKCADSSTEVRNIIRGPALSQSFKGLVTAGFVKSVIYSTAKIRKWWAGRQKKVEKK